MANRKKGVILLNMGGPDTLKDVQPFLYNLFSDREIIRLGPFFMQKILARIIARRRAPKSRAIYQKIGGSSPLKGITLRQAEALERALVPDGDWSVTIAMRYWPPTAETAIRMLREKEIDRITALSLYPHYSRATTGSSLKSLQNQIRQFAPDTLLSIISSYPTHPSYIRALAENIEKGLRRFDSGEVQVVYSAHSLPISFVEEGDPYVEHIGQTIDAVEALTGRKGRLCYQSRSGPVAWLSPSTPDMLKTLAHEGCRNILMVPISFVSDHIETLYEIAMLYRDQAAQLGMHLMPCESLNCHPLFIQGLRELVLHQEGSA